MTPLRRTLIALLAVLLAGLLGFLYYKTQGVDFARQVRVNEHLRSLRAVDAKWNEAILRSQSELLGKDVPPLQQREVVARELQGLAAEARSLDEPLLVALVASLATLYDQKQVLLAEYSERSGTFRAALRGLLADVPAAEAQVREGGAVAGRGAADRARRLLDGLAAQALEFGSSPESAGRAELADARARLLALADDLPPEAAKAVTGVAGGLEALLDAKPARDERFNRIYLFPTTPRTDSLGNAFAAAFQAQLDERELYRTYLIAYSGALLIALGYFGMQLFRSYRVIADVNARLKRANETLEQKVHERTRELSDALRHLKESEAMLVQSEKMSSLGQMVAGIAHEINTPLAYVKSSLESVTARLPEIGALVADTQVLLRMLQSGTASESQINAQFDRVSGLAAALEEHTALETLDGLAKDGLYGIGQIAELVANLKNFSRLDRNKVTRFDLREGLESTLQIARNLVKHKDVRKNFGDIPLVSCSPSQINQVFLNLVTNAAQATPETGGIIAITTRRVDDGHVAVDVQDNGHGIPPEVLPKIFDPFFTTKEIGKGTGLGLSISYKIVQAHHGRIAVKSQVGKGTRFTVTLPVAQPSPLAAQPAAAVA
jgi:signal transduction histidine kinase